MRSHRELMAPRLGDFARMAEPKTVRFSRRNIDSHRA